MPRPSARKTPSRRLLVHSGSVSAKGRERTLADMAKDAGFRLLTPPEAGDGDTLVIRGLIRSARVTSI